VINSTEVESLISFRSSGWTPPSVLSRCRDLQEFEAGGVFWNVKAFAIETLDLRIWPKLKIFGLAGYRIDRLILSEQRINVLRIDYLWRPEDIRQLKVKRLVIPDVASIGQNVIDTITPYVGELWVGHNAQSVTVYRQILN
jgi:hypothetical protein